MNLTSSIARPFLCRTHNDGSFLFVDVVVVVVVVVVCLFLRLRDCRAVRVGVIASHSARVSAVGRSPAPPPPPTPTRLVRLFSISHFCLPHSVGDPRWLTPLSLYVRVYTWPSSYIRSIHMPMMYTETWKKLHSFFFVWRVDSLSPTGNSMSWQERTHHLQMILQLIYLQWRSPIRSGFLFAAWRSSIQTLYH